MLVWGSVCLQVHREHPEAFLDAPWHTSWGHLGFGVESCMLRVSLQEFNISYHIGETLLLTFSIRYGNLIF